ncbi:hypothetical protein DFH09DRAFT_1082722 [Mycena vulgaris]|nr:hypothetical protein DFH09DRAFT_1082722 [Mycena vulgaris]
MSKSPSSMLPPSSSSYDPSLRTNGTTATGTGITSHKNPKVSLCTVSFHITPFSPLSRSSALLSNCRPTIFAQLRPPSSIPPKNPIDRLSWSYPIQKKPSYRKFCYLVYWILQFDPPPENNPDIFHDAAVTKISELARAIAVWLAAGDANTMWDRVIREIALLILEETSHILLSHVGKIFLIQSWYKTRFLRALDTGCTRPAELSPEAAPHAATAVDPPLSDFAGARCIHFISAGEEHGHSHRKTSSDTQRFGFGQTFISPDVSRQLTSAEPPAAYSIPPEVVVPSVPSPPEALVSSRHQAPVHSMGETASCILTGFFFGVMIIIVLSQRRPMLMYLS